MKLLKLSMNMLAILLFSFTTVSCAENKKSENAHHDTEMKSNDEHSHEHNEAALKENNSMSSEKMENSDAIGQDSNKSDSIVSTYLQLKNALVADDSKEAAVAAKDLFKVLKGFDISGFSKEDQKELKDIIEDASEHAEHISDSSIDHQREHLVTLSVDLVDLIAIVGSEKTLYQDFCPMANGNKGAIWLSEIKEIKNPYFGSKMLTCGSVQKEI